MGHQGRSVAGQEILAFPHANDERRAAPGADQHAGVIGADHGDAVGANHLRQSVQDRLRERMHAGGHRPEPGIMVTDQVGQHFGVGRGLEHMAGLLKPPLERFEILNHAVVNDGDAPALVQVRMGVFVGGRAVGGPAGVADAEAPGQRAALQKLRQALFNLALFLLNVQGSAVDHGHSGAVVTTVFEPAQALQQDWPRLALADIPYNATHKFI